MALGMEVGLGPGDFVFDGDPATPRTEGTLTTTQFLAHVYCGQTAEWMKTPLGTEVDLAQATLVMSSATHRYLSLPTRLCVYSQCFFRLRR